ncbi:MAG: DNA methyltransferase [Planctomycetota bacterium]
MQYSENSVLASLRGQAPQSASCRVPRSNNAIAAGLSSFTNDAAAKRLRSGRGNAAFDIARGKTKVGQTHHQRFDVARHPEKAKLTQKKMRAKDRPLANDFVSDEEFDALLHAWFGNIANYPPVLKTAGLYFSQAIIWHKQHPVLTRKDFMGDHEWCFYGWREGAAHRFFGPNNITDVWSVKKISPQSMIHLTEKPVELAVRAIQYSSRAGENVLDLFGGSGSTLIACQQTDRHAYLMELDALYCDIIVGRWEQFTGRKAKRAGGRQKKTASVTTGRRRGKNGSGKRPAKGKSRRAA